MTPETLFWEGDETAVLLIHGFTGSPPEMRPLGEALHRRGLTVLAPRLPGHGTTLEDCNRRRWMEWVVCVERAWQRLVERGGPVFVGGLSMGSLLALYLAERHPEISGVMTYSPAVRLAIPGIETTYLLQYVVSTLPKAGDAESLEDPTAASRIWCYDRWPVRAVTQLHQLQRLVRRQLDRVHQPLLIVQSRKDRSVHPRSGPTLRDEVSSTDVRLHWLHHSGHNLLVDAERDAVTDLTWAFILEHGGDRP